MLRRAKKLFFGIGLLSATVLATGPADAYYINYYYYDFGQGVVLSGVGYYCDDGTYYMGSGLFTNVYTTELHTGQIC